MWRVMLGFLLLAVSTTPGAAQQSGDAAGQLTGQVIGMGDGETVDLTYRVEDLGGKVQSLQVKETSTETRIELPADILFDFDKYDIRPSAAEALKQVGGILRERAKGTVRIEGHTDSKGTPAYNQTLSERRADAVRRWLAEREGLNKVKFAIQGFAATRPVVSNTKPDGSDDPEGRQKNRRVEIVFGKR
jgi:outer membrane protein OmpA-like peptidoglycan-associated protein